MSFNVGTNSRKMYSLKVILPKYDDEGNPRRLIPSEIAALIDKKKSSNDILIHLNNYYLGYNNILTRVNCTQDEINNRVEKPNNKLSHPYAYTITNMITGYFIGKPVRYILPDKAKQTLFDKIMEYNDSNSVDTALALDESKYGYSVEQLYLDEESNVRFNNISPYNVIFICEDNIDEDIWCVIKWSDINTLNDELNERYNVEVYYEDEVVKYYNNYSREEHLENHFKDVPFILYENNSDFMGDYERVLTLIDAYDKVESDRANDIEYNVDAFLKVLGVEMNDEEAAKMKRLRIFASTNENAKIEYVNKNVNNEPLQKYVEQINADIHKFSLTPDLNSEAFLASNASGTALKLKFQGLEMICGIKEGFFRKGLKRRIELINNIVNIKSNVDTDLISETQIVFTRNTVDNITELVELVNNLSGVISRQGQIEMLDGIVDMEKELERIEETTSNLPFITDNENSNENENSTE